uniref:Uncharacterized protein n=1 Tax=Meloidogyne incognita TaxID=6306 RepID=A0A914MTC2_MELIC
MANLHYSINYLPLHNYPNWKIFSPSDLHEDGNAVQLSLDFCDLDCGHPEVVVPAET